MRMRNAFVMAAALLPAACDGWTTAPNQTPVASGWFPAQTVPVGESVTVSAASAFSDPDGDALTYAAVSSAPGVATVAVSGADVTVTGVSAGTAMVTVTATDPGGLSAVQGLEVTVPNRAPVVTGSIPGQSVYAGEGPVSLHVAEHFNDPDGDALTYMARSSDDGVARVVMSGADMTITGVAAGTVTVSVTATDPGGLFASLGVEVAVTSDRSVLELFFEATGGTGWGRSDGWLTDAPLGAWYGVTVNHLDRVVELNLLANGLFGPIPSELGKLTKLEVLNLGWQSGIGNRSGGLTGPIPAELGNLTNLRELHLGSNGLTGSIPPWLGNLSNLTKLFLNGTALAGSIPPELGRLSKLEVLFMAWSDYSGPIPSELGQLRNLTFWQLWGNYLSGPLPSELGRLEAITHWGMEDNRLTDPFPASFTSLVDLVYINWQDNSGLCAPRTAAFDTWLARVPSEGPRCADASANRAQERPAAVSVAMRLLEDEILVAEADLADARNRTEALEAMRAIEALRDVIEELRGGQGGRRGAGS